MLTEANRIEFKRELTKELGLEKEVENCGENYPNYYS